MKLPSNFDGNIFYLKSENFTNIITCVRGRSIHLKTNSSFKSKNLKNIRSDKF